MNKERWLDALIGRIKELAKWIACIAVDSVFLILWAAIQYLVDLLIQRLNLSGISQWTLVVFQIIFAVSTLAPVILYVYADIRVMAIRTSRRIRQEAQSDETSSRDDT